MSKILNPALYRQLKNLFGEVRVANEGMRLIINKKQNEYGKTKLWKEQGGEEYRVCCPFCGDRRFRLYINHAWGLDNTAGYPSSKLLVCHNEHCEQNTDREANVAIYLRQHLRPYFSDIKNGIIAVNPVTDQEIDDTVAAPLPFPDKKWCTKLYDLEETHPAVRYVFSRKFDLEELSDRWGVVYVHKYPVKVSNRNYSWLGDRLFIPTGNDGWQARSLDPAEKKLKYVSCPGWKKSRDVYNVDDARQHLFAVIVEGVTDVWRLGSPGVAIYGKRISNKQVEILAANFNSVALVLDPDAFVQTSKYKSQVPDGTRTLQMLSKHIPNVMKVTLPAGRDVADYDRDVIWDRIEQTAAKRSLPEIKKPEHKEL